MSNLYICIFFCTFAGDLENSKTMNFTHLHVHSHYSVLDGMSKISDLVDKCIRTGMPAIALTDHGNMYGIKEFLDYSKKANGQLKAAAEEKGETFIPFKPIVGIEAYCARRGRLMQDKDYKVTNGEGKTQVVDMSGWHLILLAKNKTGYQNLCRLTSLSFIDGFYRTARIDKELLAECREGLICSSACLGGEISQKVMEGLLQSASLPFEERFKAAIEAAKWFKSIFGEDYYLEIQRHQTDKEGADQMVYQKQKDVNEVLVEIAKRLDSIPLQSNNVVSNTLESIPQIAYISNEAAIQLYKKLGFIEAGIRKNFYEKPRENAIFMWKR
mgnify:CR=1 FL=1